MNHIIKRFNTHDVLEASEESVLFAMGGLCGDIRALTYIPDHFIEPVNDHHLVRTLPLPTLLQRIYLA